MGQSAKYEASCKSMGKINEGNYNIDSSGVEKNIPPAEPGDIFYLMESILKA